jgi:hypothetical protein
VVGISTPDEFKKAMPWQSKPPVGISGKKLMDDGQAIPPFHGRCRCIIVEHDGDNDITEKSFDLGTKRKLDSFDTDTRIAVIKGSNLPATGLSGWKYDRIRKDGVTSQRRFFDEKGNKGVDIDMTGHNSEKKHFGGAHAHDWNGPVRGEARKPKKWEAEMVEEMARNTKINIEKKESDPFSSPHYFASVEDLIRDNEIGGETEFEYEGHTYFYTRNEAWECLETSDGVYGEFKDITDILDNFKVHTGETLREIATKIEVTSYESDVDLV